MSRKRWLKEGDHNLPSKESEMRWDTLMFIQRKCKRKWEVFDDEKKKTNDDEVIISIKGLEGDAFRGEKRCDDDEMSHLEC